MESSSIHRLSPISFDEVIHKLTEDFTGCEDIFNAIDRWLECQNERFFILVGKPGAGKSAVAAYLTKIRPDIVAHHFCIARRNNTIDPNSVLLSLAAQLVENLPGYAEALVNTITPLHLSVSVSIDIEIIRDSQVRGVIIEHLHTNNPGEALDIILHRPILAISSQIQEPILILLDALDEAIAFSSNDNLVRLLASANDLSSYVRFLCTTRSEQRVWSYLDISKIYRYDLKNQSSTIYRYINSRLSRNALQIKIQNLQNTREIFTNELLEKSQDNFLYVKLLLDEIESDRYSINELASLPSGLNKIYSEFINRSLEGVSRNYSKLILGILAVAREPLSQQQISQFTGVELEDVGEQIRVIRQFFDVFDSGLEEKYTLFHQSFRDYLIDSKNKPDFWCDPTRQHQRIVNFYWSDKKVWSQEHASDRYLWNYLPYHLSQATQDEQLRSLLLNFEWLQAKLNATNIHRLIADYDLLSNDQDLVLVQQALRLSIGVIEQDSRQLASQLLGRLITFPTKDIQLLIEQIAERQTAFPWFRCLTASLTPPGGALVGTCCGHNSYVSSIAWIPRQRQMVSASRDYTLRLWNVDSTQCLRVLKGHENWIRGVVVTSSGDYAISVSDDATVKQWDLKSGESQNILEAHNGDVTAIATGLDNDQVVVALSNHEVGIWQADSQQYGVCFQIPDRVITAITVLQNQRQIILVLDDCTFQLWDLLSKKHQRTFKKEHNGSITAVAFIPNENRVISASYDLTLKVWNLENGKVEQTLQGHFQPVSSVVIMLDGKRAISSSRDRTLRVWDLSTGECLSTFLAHQDWINCVTLVPDGCKVVSASDDGTLKVWDLEHTQQLLPIHHNNQINDLALTPNGSRLVSASRDKTLKAWNMKTEQLEHTFQGHEAQVMAVAVISDHQAISASADKTLKVWDLNTGSCLCTFKGHSSPINGVAVFRDGRTAISASLDKTLRLWDIATGKCQRIFEGHEGSVTTVKVLPDQNQVISASADGMLRIWNIHTGECQLLKKSHSAPVTSVAVTPDGMWVVSASADRAVKLWNLEIGSCELTLGNHEAWIHSVVLTSDGHWAVSASEDKTLKLWDLRQRECAASFTGESKFRSCAILADTQTIFAGNDAGQVHTFEILNSENG
ncbi:WD40 repeat domain-containing protein [Stenomitos frigidus]|uniref:Uncharacterized protein n=1 Tax=Stenomitos frigidus ULC18 TaxID=2107698 RepID=A0A2T1ELU6_9CYAN|nr:WD40 repeat domain-containing protein [Stenomitos frigidus]PSB33706.1 hypothetical protein C7B82_04275 [Stenomitos frigidus ULC18]